MEGPIPAYDDAVPASTPFISVHGHHVAVTAVAFEPTRLDFELAVLPSQLRDREHEAHEEAMSRWSQQASRLRDQAGPPPVDPANFLNDLELHVSDDKGTQYQWVHRWGGGSGVEWKGLWRFTPGPPANARYVTLTSGCSTEAVRSFRIN